MNKNLFESDSDGETPENLEIQLNKEYAKSYNKFRQKELYQKIKAQDLNDSDLDGDDSSSSDSSDNENDPKFDQEFFKALSSLKSRDPKIYDKNVKFFDVPNDNESNDDNYNKVEKSKKPLTLKDYERKVILEKNGKYSDDSEDEENQGAQYRSNSPSYAEEEKQLKKEFQQILNEEESDEEFGGVFKRRQKTKEQNEQEETEFTKWLAGQNDNVTEETKSTLKPLKEFWTKPNLPKQEKFLRDYILNKAYKDTDIDEIPTYEEIIGDTNLSEDEKELDKQEEFEHKYNFRYEEPDQEFIKRFPRTIENSVRQTDDSRKRKRLELKERKQKEKEEKMKHIEVLKEMKRQEIEEKIRKLKEVTGNDELPFQDNELEEDFDPQAHDRKMQEIFNEDYYQIPEGEEKPECPDIEELKYEDWDNFNPNSEETEQYEPHCEDDDFNMDCDYNANTKEQLQNELIESTRKKGRKCKNHFMEIIKKEKPAFNPEDEKTYEQYLDEYYKLDCEDMIGDLPCRFKYVDCVPNNFGLTIEEILLAKNKELNQWASLKKAVQIRSEHVEKNEVHMYKRKAQNLELKKKIFQSIYGEPESEDEDEPKKSTAAQNETITKVSQIKEANEAHTFMKKETPKQKSKGGILKTTPEATIVTNTPEATIVTNKPEPPLVTNKQDSHVDSKVVSKKKKKSKSLNNKDKPNTSIVNVLKSHSKNVAQKNENVVKKKIELNAVNVKKNLTKSASNPFQNKKDITHKISKDHGIQKQSNKNVFNKNNKQNQSNKNKNKNKFKSIAKDFKNDKDLSDERLKAYGINPKKFNKTQNYLQFQNKTSKTKKLQKKD